MHGRAGILRHGSVDRSAHADGQRAQERADRGDAGGLRGGWRVLDVAEHGAIKRYRHLADTGALGLEVTDLDAVGGGEGRGLVIGLGFEGSPACTDGSVGRSEACVELRGTDRFLDVVTSTVVRDQAAGHGIHIELGLVHVLELEGKDALLAVELDLLQV